MTMTEFMELAKQADILIVFFSFCAIVCAGWGYLIAEIIFGIYDGLKSWRKKRREKKAQADKE